MQRKKSKSAKKSVGIKKKKIDTKRMCMACSMVLGLNVHIQEALYRKYSCYQFWYLEQIEQLRKNPTAQQQQPREYLEKFYKPLQRRHQFSRVRDIYKLHKDAPRLFMPVVRDIIMKCQERRRLLDYFRIAKILGLKVESAKTSTFLYSLSKTYRPGLSKPTFENMLGPISGYEFSQQIQKQLIQSLQSHQPQQIQKLDNKSTKALKPYPKQLSSLNPQLKPAFRV